MRRIPKVTPERTDELTRVAAELFNEQGFDATSMQDIADRMGILKGSLYHYVRTKEDLLWVVMEPSFRELVTTAQRILADESVALNTRLVAVMVAHAERYELNFPHMFVMTRENGETLSAERRAGLDVLRRDYFALVVDALIAGQEAGEIRDDIDATIAGHAIFGMLNWMFRWFSPGKRLKARDVAQQFATVTVAGLMPPRD
jgi:AcrR family transcriptional regulator